MGLPLRKGVRSAIQPLLWRSISLDVGVRASPFHSALRDRRRAGDARPLRVAPAQVVLGVDGELISLEQEPLGEGERRLLEAELGGKRTLGRPGAAAGDALLGVVVLVTD